MDGDETFVSSHKGSEARGQARLYYSTGYQIDFQCIYPMLYRLIYVFLLYISRIAFISLFSNRLHS